ncbi:CFI-box-CTERM domain-containing protein [Pseudomonas marginalis]|uniref:CFI-box-CTERM domain-containing protein n=1 Tax=Pseudomonas marginalis TaxID=298 RepID=UPI0005FA9F07|nr:CFI-box-CTERM domain-containing protein [Pseudomonas marginalis]KJZ57309.1 hypothetical protein VC36_18200 [Pseudomonas marginalis]
MSAASRPTTANLLGMAKTAELGGNQAEAESYFNRVLEIDPTLTEAWLGKGKAAGWQSTLVNMRLGEVVIAFNHAISTAPAEEKSSIIETCSIEANTIVVALYTIARKHMLEYVALPNSWADYLGQIGIMLNTLEAVHLWQPSQELTLENIVHLCKDSIEGVSYRDQFDNNNSKAVFLSPDYEVVMRARLEAAAEKLRLIDPNYSAPTAVASKPDSCFVVTATMGDFNHPNVTILRKFRDERMLKYESGKKFVAWYYRNGPGIANVIRRSKTLRMLSYALIVLPAAQIAKTLIRRAR